MSIAKKGKLALNPDKAEIDTRFIASEEIDFGAGVEFADTEGKLQMYGTGDANYFAGIALEANEKIDSDDTRSYDSGDTMKVLKKGAVFVELLEDIAATDDPTNIGCANSNVSPGQGCFGLQSTSNYDDVNGLELVEVGNDGDEVPLRVNLPQ